MPRSWEKDRQPREPIKPGEKLWVHIAYSKQDDGKIACTLTSNVPLERGVDYVDMKVYAPGRVYSQFAVAPGGAIHIDGYANGGEDAGIKADFKVTDQAVEVVNSVEIEATASPVERWVPKEVDFNITGADAQALANAASQGEAQVQAWLKAYIRKKYHLPESTEIDLSGLHITAAD